MTDFLYSLDKSLFIFINQTLSNPVGDALWPLITNYDRFLIVRVLLLGVWLWLLFRGGRRGRTAALMIIPLIALSDQLNSAVLKTIFHRPRPCHEIGGIAVIQHIHMLVACGPGNSFPSSHAVNNFAAATLFSFYYRRWMWAFLAWASLVALSRPAVGVHYPSDIIGGAILGAGIAALVIWIWQSMEKHFFRPPDEGSQQGSTL